MNRLELTQAELDALREGRRYAAVTIMEARGLARSYGKMLVFPDGSSLGTVGGGPGELAAKQDALRCLTVGTNAVKTYEFSFDNAAGQRTELLTVSIEVCADERAPLVILGGGHVGQAVLRLAETAGFAVTLIDDRDPALLGGAAERAERFLRVGSFADVAALTLPSGAFYVICISSPELTAETVQAVLAHKDAAYVGLLTSRKKLAFTQKHLLAHGVSKAALDRIYAPIGLDLGGETPEELAVSIVAQLIAVRYDRPIARKSKPTAP